MSESRIVQLTASDITMDEQRLDASLWQLGLRRLRRDYLTIAAIVVILIIALLALLAPVISNQILNVNYTKTSRDIFLPIGSAGHILGTDDIGRDYFSRLLYGGRVSMGIAFSSAVISILIGITLGLISGYYQGGPLKIVDDTMMWFITTLNSIPTLYLLIILVAAMGGNSTSVRSSVSLSVLSLVLILSLLGWTGTLRLVRGETISQKNREYIVAAHAIGVSTWRIMFSHILPNVFSVIIVSLAIDIGNLILVESTLSYLGLGVQEPTPSWGNMLTDAQTFFTRGLHLLLIPGTLIGVTVLCLYIIGDGLRDAFDPQTVKK
ncbi:MAG: ABC transporter permease [Anaerolineae bacterium]|nr:MAG: ABC transporter permease [Anaerolineae bacterium]